MNFSGAIFDMDGTLIDSMPLWYDIGSQFLRQKGYIPRQDLNEVLVPMSVKDSAEYLIKEYHVSQSSDEIISGFNELMEQNYIESIPLKPGVELFLKRLKERNVKMCVATATDVHLAEPALKRLGIMDYFEGIITCSQAGIGKTDPEFYYKALKLINTPVSETLVFEDALHAIKSAKKAGFLVAGVYDKSAWKEKEEISFLVDCYLNSYDEWEMNQY